MIEPERDEINGRKQYGYSCGSLALQSPGGSSVAMFKSSPSHR